MRNTFVPFWSIFIAFGWAIPFHPQRAYAQAVSVTGTVTMVRSKQKGDGKPGSPDVVVWLKPLPGAAGREPEKWTPGSRPRLRLVQHRKRFDPHVMVVPLNSVVEFPNLDPFFHNVFSMFDGKRFDLGLYEAGTTHSVTFDRPGVCFIFCNIHPEMSAVVVVLDTPYFAVSKISGAFSISGVPAGHYLVSVWSERCEPGSIEGYPREVAISESNASLGAIRLVEAGNLLSPHKNKYGYDYETPDAPTGIYEPR
jgi:plastocyanin